MAKKKMKKGGIIALCILGVFLIIVAALLIYMFTDKDYGLTAPLNADPFFAEWQSYISDDAKLNEVVTVGSHDAGTNGMVPLAMTQGHQIIDQLKGGSRYFDVRVTNKGNDLAIFHSVIKGQSFSTVLNDVKTFIEEHPTEFIILDFQHLGDKAHAATLSAIENTLDMSKAMKKSLFPNVEAATMGDVRANGYNFIIVWKDPAEASEKDYLYTREHDLLSPYESKIHRSKDPNKLTAYYQNYYDSYDGTGFFVLQAQRTAPVFLIDKPSGMEVEYKPIINAYIDALATSPNLAKTNIIMRDFVVSDMNNVKKILKLNLDKNLVKADSISTYQSMVAS